jgi:glycosyltransferase involved in cell wall biosynthesis
MPTGNGAYIVHKLLESAFNDYSVCGYHPNWTYAPPLMRGLCGKMLRSAQLVHTTPDHAPFFHRDNIPLVLTFHNYVLDAFMQRYSTPLQRIHYATDLKWFTRRSLALATIVTCVSQFTADLVYNELNYQGNIRIIHNGVDTNRFVPSARPHRNSSEVRVLFAGNLSLRKGANLLPKIALHLNPGVKLLVASGLRGKGDFAKPDRIESIGNIPYDKMPELYQDVDILLFPTVREGFGLVAAEAMASGLPVVATDCSALPELVINGQGGYLCQLGEPLQFSRRINELAENPDLRMRMGAFNRARVEQLFTLERMLDQYRQLFDEVLSTA